MATVSFEIPNAPILAALKEHKGFDAEALTPNVGVQTSPESRTLHVTLNFELTPEEWDSIVGAKLVGAKLA